MQNENTAPPENRQPLTQPLTQPVTQGHAINPPTPTVIQPTIQQDIPQTGYDYAMDRRVSAFILDVVLWVPAFIIASQHFGTYSVSGGMVNFNLTGAPFVVFLLVFTAYYVLFECLIGATLGKLAVGIRVIDEQGNKPSFIKSLIRNVLRIVDGFPYIIPNLVGFIVVSTSDKKQRLGDKAAHTTVVKMNKARPAATWAWLSLAALVMIGVAIIILVPASKKTTSSIVGNSRSSYSNQVSSVQGSAAKTVSDRIFNDVIAGNSKAVYQMASPALKQAQTEQQLAAGIQQIDQIITGTPQPDSQASYPNSSESTFMYSVQTTQGTKQLIVDLRLINGDWLLYSSRMY